MAGKESERVVKEHRPSSTGGSILMFEPAGTSSTGDDPMAEVPDHVDSTTGHDL